MLIPLCIAIKLEKDAVQFMKENLKSRWLSSIGFATSYSRKAIGWRAPYYLVFRFCRFFLVFMLSLCEDVKGK